MSTDPLYLVKPGATSPSQSPGATPTSPSVSTITQSPTSSAQPNGGGFVSFAPPSFLSLPSSSSSSSSPSPAAAPKQTGATMNMSTPTSSSANRNKYLIIAAVVIISALGGLALCRYIYLKRRKGMHKHESGECCVVYGLNIFEGIHGLQLIGICRIIAESGVDCREGRSFCGHTSSERHFSTTFIHFIS